MSTILWTTPREILIQYLPFPAGIPPTGQVSDFNAPNPWTLTIYIAGAVMLFFSILFVMLRFWAQRRGHGSFVAEDYIIFVALTIYICNAVISILALNAGVGKDMWNLTIGQIFKALKFIWAFTFTFTLGQFLIRVAIVLQFKRVLAPRFVNKPAWIFCWTFIGLHTLFVFITLMIAVTACIPLKAVWDPNVQGHCIAIPTLWELGVIVDSLFDFGILAIPIPIILRLKMNLRRKLLVLVVFTIGIGACGLSIARIIYTFRIWRGQNPSYGVMVMGIFTQAESTIGFLVFFMPKAPLLFIHIRDKMRNALNRHTSTLDPPPEQIEREIPRVPNPYDLPSLASFEQESGRHFLPRIEHMPSLEVIDSDLSEKSKSSSPEPKT